MFEKINISKIVLYICATVVIIFIVRSCQLTPEVVQECQKACGELGNRVREINNRTCECTGESVKSSSTSDTKWLIPGK